MKISALFICSFDFSTPIFSTTSSVILIPAVSIKFKVTWPKLILASTISRVVPGILVTIALFSPINVFNKLLLPTLGFPTITVFIPFFNSFALLALFNTSSSSNFIVFNLGKISSLVYLSLIKYMNN